MRNGQKSPRAKNPGAAKNTRTSPEDTSRKRARREQEVSALDAGLSLVARRGWPIFPVRYVRDGERVRMRPCTAHGFKDATADPEGVRHYWSKFPTAQIAMPTGAKSGVFVVDLDRKEAGKDGVATWESLATLHGGAAPATLSARSPNGRHLFFRYHDGVRNVALDKIGPGIEIKGDGGSVTLAPSRRPDGAYEWENDVEPAEAPQWLIDLIFNSRPARSISDRLDCDDCAGRGLSNDPEDLLPPPDNKTIQAALDVIDPDIERSEWIAIGCALFKALGDDEGFKIWNEWSSDGAKYKDHEMHSQWASIKTQNGYGWNIGTLFHHANEADPNWRNNITSDDESSSEVIASGDESLEVEPAKPRNYEIVRASDITMRAKNWLWRGHLLRGALELTTGIPGLGKSQVQCSLVACATAGLKWPDGSVGGEPVNVIMVTAEDTLDQEVVPRLLAAKADPNRVYILKKIKRDNKQRMFLLGEDIETLALVIRDVGNVGLVTLDPITAFMGKLDSHRTTDVRDQLGPLAALAERTQVAVSAITHPPKAAGQRAIDHFIGSQAFIAAARIGHLCAQEIENERSTGRVLFTNPKNNPHMAMPTLAYRIQSLVVGQDPETNENIVPPFVVWEGVVPINADQAVAAAHTGGRPGRKNEAKEFLERVLANGPVAVKRIEEEAAAHGLSKDQLRRAKAELSIKVWKDGAGPWVWGLKPEEW